MRNKLFAALAVISVFAVTSCDNKNLFGKFHKAGSSASIEVLLSDANSALANDNPAEAKAIADKILAKDPNNSEALYISAAAGLKVAGFDVAGILISVIGSTATADAGSLLESFANLDLNAISKAIDISVQQLKRIADDGDTNGAIADDDIDVNLNLGILEILNAAINIIDFNDNYTILNDTSDVVQIDDNYKVTVKVGTGTYKSVSELTDDEVVQLKDLHGDALANKVGESITQIDSAVNHFTVASNGVAGGSSIMDDLKNTVSNDLKTEFDDFYSRLTSTST
ncbi:MAG: hypothetical protein CVU78_00890 [Elusimicrobia bacterium HGW-Elusimicrobia-2]|nr:MAG: hypothetical protein CVU78_00890 [Elusimicrobia bacterium HGW-Elusimicrobia-2]